MLVASTGIAIVSFANCVIVHVETIRLAHARLLGSERLSVAPALTINAPESVASTVKNRKSRTLEGYDDHSRNSDRYAVERRNECDVTTDARGLHRPRQPHERD